MGTRDQKQETKVEIDIINHEITREGVALTTQRCGFINSHLIFFYYYRVNNIFNNEAFVKESV